MVAKTLDYLIPNSVQETKIPTAGVSHFILECVLRSEQFCLEKRFLTTKYTKYLERAFTRNPYKANEEAKTQRRGVHGERKSQIERIAG